MRCGYDDIRIVTCDSFGLQTESVITARTNNIKHRQGYVPRRVNGQPDCF